MALLKTVAEIKLYFNVDGSFDFNTVLPYVELAEDDVKRILGDDQYEELDDYYNGVASGLTELDDLLPFCQRSIVYFAFLKGLDKFNVSIGNNGIAIIHNTNLAPASEKRVENLRQNITDSGWDSLEFLLQFLETNIDDYPLWESSDSYAYQYAYLINSARDFDELFRIKRSRLTFLDWRSTMADVELLQINPVVSVELMDELKTQIKANTVSVNNNLILNHLRKALAYLVAAKQDYPKMQPTGEHYLMLVRTMLDASPDDYPTYKTSSVYDADLESYEKYENEEDSNVGVFG